MRVPCEFTLTVRKGDVYKDVIERQTYTRVTTTSISIPFIVRNVEK